MRAALALAGLILTLALAPVLPAKAAAVACQGEAATIVDTDGGDVDGTDGDDVIYAEGESTIAALDGDDLICFENGYVFGGDGRDSVHVVGNADHEDLDIRDAEDLDLTIGSGGGVVQLVNVRQGEGTVDLTGGAYLRLIGKKSVLVDLEDDLMVLNGATYTLLGNPGIFTVARRVELHGDAADNTFDANQYSCRIVIRGHRGADHLTVAGSDGDLPFPEHCAGWRGPYLFGQRGNDTLQGRGDNDTLIGGVGRDKAYGSRGVDTCAAEVEKNCERDPG